MSAIHSSLRTFLPISASVFLAVIGFGMMVPALPILMSDVGAGAVATGFLLSGFGLARLLVNVPAGLMSDRVGVRATAMLGLVILFLGSAIGAVPGGYAMLCLALALQGAGSAVFATAAMSALADAGGPDRRGAAMSWFQGAFLLAISGGPVIGGWLVGLIGPRAPFMVHAALVIVTLAGIAVFPRGTSGGGARGGLSLGLALKPMIAAACALALASFAARSAVGWALVPATAATEFRLTPNEIGLLVGFGTLTSLIATPPLGWAIDRIGAVPVLVVSGIATALALIGFVVMPHVSMLWLMTSVVMIGTAGLTAAGGALTLAEASGTGTGTALGLFRTAGDVGLTLGPAAAPSIAMLIGHGPLHGYSVTAACVALALGVLAFGLTRTPKVEPAPAE